MEKVARMSRNWRKVHVAIFCFAFLVSCSSKPERAILGKWNGVDGNESMEFFRDGTVSVVFEEGMAFGGSFSFIEKDRIKFDLGGLAAIAGPIIAQISIKGNNLTLIMPDGTSTQYKRAK